GVITPSALGLLVGCAIVLYTRLEAGKPLVPLSFFTIPVVVATFVYFAIGLSTFSVAEDKFTFWKEVVQRTLIIMLPLYLFSMGPRKPEHLKTAILTLLPCCSVVCLVALQVARSVGFSKPVYVLGMHKNQIAGTCAVMGVIAVSCLLTSRSRKKKLIFAGFLILACLGCLSTQGRAGLLCILISTVFMLVAIRAKWKTLLYFVLAVSISGAAILKMMPKEAIEHAVSTQKFSSNQLRVALWSEVYPMLAEDPWVAVGWGQPRQYGTQFYGDVANVFLFDWMQMGILGGIALLVMIGCAVWLPLENAWRMPTNTLLSFINLVALGVIVARFTHGMLDTFWIGRGCNLTTWMAIGMTVFVRLLLDQNEQRRMIGSSRSASVKTGRQPVASSR
ncbi:MAG TPA: O-antigen ligase family protein, partial [Chroococcales cyanobacterium]